MNRYRIRVEERGDKYPGRTTLIASMGFTVHTDAPLAHIFGVALNAIRMFGVIQGWTVLHDEERAAEARGKKWRVPMPSPHVPPPQDAP